jgi:hypothetical protein
VAIHRSALSIFFGQPVAIVLTVLSVLAVFVVPPAGRAPGSGSSAVGAPSLHMFGLLFLLGDAPGPAEIGLLAAILVATYVASFIWVAIVLVAGRWRPWTLASALAARRHPEAHDFEQSARVVQADS